MKKVSFKGRNGEGITISASINFLQLHDMPQNVDEAVSVLAPFFRSKLSCVRLRSCCAPLMLNVQAA
jgi:hypothetical protein